jgi:hypothetical protein
MYAIEFETNITSPFIPLHNYEQFLNQQVKVIVMAQDDVKPANRIDANDYFKKVQQRRFNVPSDVNVADN